MRSVSITFAGTRLWSGWGKLPPVYLRFCDTWEQNSYVYPHELVLSNLMELTSYNQAGSERFKMAAAMQSQTVRSNSHLTLCRQDGDEISMANLYILLRRV